MKARASSSVLTPRSPMYFKKPSVLSRAFMKAASASVTSRRMRRSVSTIIFASVLSIERLDVAGLSEHLVDLVEMTLFEHDHLSGIFFESNIVAFTDLEQFVVSSESRAFLFKTFAQDIANVVFVSFEQRP